MVTSGTDFHTPPIELDDTKLSNSFNVYAKDNKLIKRFGYIKFGNGLPLPNPIVHFDQFYKYDGTEYFCCFTTKNIYVFNTSTLYWDLKTPNVLIDDCETAWRKYDYNVTTSIDTTWKRYGTYSAKTAIGVDFGTGIVSYKNFSSAMNLSSYTDLHFYIKSDIDLAAGDIKILLNNSDVIPFIVDSAFESETAFDKSSTALLETIFGDIQILPNDSTVPSLKQDVLFEIETAFANASNLSLFDTIIGDIQMLPDDSTIVVHPVESLSVPALTANTPLEINVAFAVPANLTSIKSIALQVINDKGAANIWIDDIRAVKCYNSTISKRWQSEMIYDSDSSEIKFVATNNIDNVQSWNGTGNWADLPGTVGSPNKAKIIKNYYQYLVLMNETVGGNAAPQRIEWCVEGRPTHWTDAGSGNNSLAQAADFIVGAEFLQSNIAIFKERSITIMGFTGLSAPFAFDELRVVDIGCSAAGSIQTLGTSLLFLGWDGFYIFDGFNCEPPKSSIDINDKLIELLNPAALDTIHSHIIENYNMCLFFVPTVSSTYPNAVWCYDYLEDRFYYWELTDPITATGHYQSVDKMKISQLLGKIGTLNFKIGSRQLTDLAPLDILGDNNGYIYQVDFSNTDDDGVAVRSFFDTKSYFSLDQYSRLVELILYATGSDVYIQFSIDDGISWSEVYTITLSNISSSPAFLRNANITSEKTMIRIGNDKLGGRFEISGWVRRFISKERVVK